MKQSKDFFWPSYVDLMTALFLTMLVLFVLSYKLFKDKEHDLINERDKFRAAAAQLELIKRIERSLEAMMGSNNLFEYQEKHRRYTLKKQISFQINQWDLSQPQLSLIDQRDVPYLLQVGQQLKAIVNKLQDDKEKDTELKDISYVLAIVGNASNLNEPPQERDRNYILSYKRAKSLYEFWRQQGVVDFDDKKYHEVIELIIAGNGWGGVGRVNEDQPFNYIKEMENQRFLIQIIPKVGKVIK